MTKCHFIIPCKTLLALIKTTSVGRPHSCSWGGGRLDWEEGRRHFSSGRQLPPGWRTFTHFVAYHAFYDLFKIPKITEAELNELSRWSRRPCLSSSLPPTTSTSRSAPFLTFSTSKSFILTPGSLGPHLQGCCQQDQRWVFIAQQSIIKNRQVCWGAEGHLQLWQLDRNPGRNPGGGGLDFSSLKLLKTLSLLWQV